MMIRSSGAKIAAPTPRSVTWGRRSPAASSSRGVATYSATRALLRRSAGGRNPPMPLPLVAAQDDLFVVLDVLEDLACTEHDTGERVLGDADVEIGDLAQEQVESAQQGAAAGQEDAAVDDVRRQLGRGALEGFTQGVDDLAHRLLQRFADLDTRDPQRAWYAAHQIATLDFHVHFLGERERGADLDLDPLRGLLADEHVVGLLGVVLDRFVHLVAAGADRGLGDDPVQ